MKFVNEVLGREKMVYKLFPDAKVKDIIDSG